MAKIITEGHRGCAALYPENTMISFKNALEMGVDAYEFDVWLTKDKVPVIMHDGNPLRTCGVDGHLRDMTYAEVQQLDPCYESKFGDRYKGQLKVPTLYEVLDLGKTEPGFKFGVEIKEYTEETVDITIKALTDRKISLTDDCWFYAFNGRIIRYIKQKYNGRTMGYPDIQMAEFCGYDHYDEIGLSMMFVRSELCEFYVKKGMPVHMYCADNADDVKLCIERGASLITANDPRALLDIAQTL